MLGVGHARMFIFLSPRIAEHGVIIYERGNINLISKQGKGKLQSWDVGILLALGEVFLLVTNSGWRKNSNIKFLEKYMGASFVAHPQPWITNVNVDDIHSRDFLAISKI
ncbi:hypothetical protein E2542_SST21710 [Spatholobus suberectus]|nr:hypothetical protein E2542_SST21710 [Spatholobus suberectus]